MSLCLLLLLAPCFGSFVGVLVRRLPQGRPVALARSACESCGAPIAARDMVPLLGFLLLRGRCRRCHAPIAPFHWAAELAGLAVAAMALAAFGTDDPAWLWIGCGLGWALLALAWIDALWFTLPDPLTLPLLLAGLGVTLWLDPASTPAHAAAAAGGYLVFRGIALAYRRLRGAEGLGEGDAKLLAALGAWGGPALLGPTVLGAALLGLGWAGALALARRPVGRSTRLPFGTLLCASFWALWLLTS